ncbi:MAG: family 1 glycosylhydrolase [Acidimicrobiales bacterium]
MTWKLATAASSLGAEGAAPTADWFGWERDGRAPASGDGNGFATNAVADFALLAEHGITTHRMTIEWARLEPTRGAWDAAEEQRYREILEAAGRAGVDVWVCLHHLSLPGWFSEDERGFLDERMARRVWPAHVDRVAAAVGDLVAGWIPIDQPATYAAAAFRDGAVPPGRSSGDDHQVGLVALRRANREAARLLGGGDAPVACAHAPGEPADELKLDAEVFDRIGLAVPADVGSGVVTELRRLLDQLGDDTVALAITSCGVATNDEDERAEKATAVASQLDEAEAEGIDVRELFWWTAIDGYEPTTGFELSWGLFDRARNPRPALSALTGRE